MSIVTYNNRSIANISAIPGAAKSLTLIKTLTASSSSTLSFVNGSDDVVLDSTYPIYLFKFINIHPATNATHLQFNGSDDTSSHSYDVTKTTTNFGAYHRENDGAAVLGYETSQDIAQGTGFQGIAHIISNQNDASASGEMRLFSPSSTTFVKHFMSVTNRDNNDYQGDNYTAGYFNTTSAITAIQFKMSSGNIDAGTIKLYGIKDS